MKRLSTFLLALSIFTVLHAQNCENLPIANPNSNIFKITAEYKQIIEQQMGDNDTMMPTNFMEIAQCYVQNIQQINEKMFDIPGYFMKKRPDVVFLILASKSLDDSNEKQSWFNLVPIMTSEQIDKLYDILIREFLKIHRIERQYEKRIEEIANKNEYVNVSDSLFKIIGVTTQYSSLGIRFGTKMDEYYINQDGVAVCVSDGRIVPLDSIEILTGENIHDLKVDNPIEASKISDYENFICSFLHNVQNAQATFPPDSLSKNILFSLWKTLLNDYYKKAEKLSIFQQFAIFPMEDYVEDLWKKETRSLRYNYLMLSKLKEFEYDKAAEFLTLYIQNTDGPRSPQEFLFRLYISVLGNNSEFNNSAYTEAEQSFVEWLKKADKYLLPNMGKKYTGTEFLMADYYLLYGNNGELKEIVNKLLSKFKEQLSYGNIRFQEWYQYLNNAYFADGFTGNYTLQDLNNQLSQRHFFNNENFVEYATYYCLYKIKHFQSGNPNSSELTNLLSILDYIDKKCASPNSQTYYFCEKDIAKDLKNRIFTHLSEKKLMGIPPKIQFVSKFPKATKKQRQSLQFIAGNGTADIQSLEVSINGKPQKVREFTEPVGNDVWRYYQTFDLVKGGNSVVIRCVDVDGREACDTVTIDYNPENYMDRKDYAILFAVDDYSKVTRFNNLEKPIQDAERFAELLVEYGFDTLIVRNPTRASIYKTIETYSNKEYGKYDQLLIFYAGHGYIDNHNIGYIIPSDGNLNETYDLVDYFSFAGRINTIPCNHILFICDACHSGSFLAQQTREVNPDVKLQNEIMQHRSRQFIGSCTAKDETPDNSQLMSKIFDRFKKQKKDEPIDYFSLIGLATTSGGQEKTFGNFGSHEQGGDFFFNRR